MITTIGQRSDQLSAHRMPSETGGVHIRVRDWLVADCDALCSSGNDTPRSGGRLEVLREQLLGHGLLPGTCVPPLKQERDGYAHRRFAAHRSWVVSTRTLTCTSLASSIGSAAC